jgi:hypothetical protein
MRCFLVFVTYGDEVVTVWPVWAKTAGGAIVRTHSLIVHMDWWPSPRAAVYSAKVENEPTICLKTQTV